MKTTAMQFSTHRLLALVLLCAIVLSSCAALPTTTATPTQTSTPTPTLPAEEDDVRATLTFNATLPTALAEGQSLSLEILDEVTGLALNPQRYPMEIASAMRYSLTLPFAVGSVIKYRYLQEGKTPAYEYNSVGNQVRYRLYHVTNPAEVNDKVLAWNNLPYEGDYGRVQGVVTLADPGNSSLVFPVSGSLVTIGGQQTFTASDGSFIVDKLPPGVYPLVVYSQDGSHSVFQQHAEVAAQSATPANIQVEASHNVAVTFIVQPPEGNPTGIPIRLLGNIYQLGNTFADLRGGINGIASRAPLLKVRADNRYEITLNLPAGLDLRYKYSLGDGFWNAERTAVTGFKLRQLIVPDQDVTIEDTVETWGTHEKAPITFRVTVPDSTPPTDTISIQFNPYGWTEPIPMWPLGQNQWLYVLYSPLDLIGETTYRYCRNEQCGIADDLKTKGADAAGTPFLASEEPLVFDDQVAEWNWAAQTVETITVPSGDIPAKPDGFVTGIELTEDYHPSWQPYFSQAFQNVADLSANAVILSPTWHFSTVNPPVVGIVPGVDAAWYDLTDQVAQARKVGLQVAIHPTVAFYQPTLNWWTEAQRDRSWWQTWFDRYETFLINYADLATQLNADVLILGDSNITPALPGGKLPDGSPSNVPDTAAARWEEILQKVREHYQGKLAWYLTYPDDYANTPDFLGQVDQIYVVVAGSLSDSEQPTDEELLADAQHVLTGDIQQLYERFEKPVLIGINYPSANGAATGCVKSSDTCLPAMVFKQGGLEIPAVETDARLQAQVYNALLQAISEVDWVSGVFSSGYFPPVALADQSDSIHGKPAADVVGFWYDRFHQP